MKRIDQKYLDRHDIKSAKNKGKTQNDIVEFDNNTSLHKIKEGEYVATLTVNKLILDAGTMKQIRQLMQNPTVNQPVFMPDVHAGVGSCVGFTCYLTDKVAPSIISGDIGCGITIAELDTNILEKYKLDKIDEIIRSKIPIDEGYTAIYDEPVVIDIDLQNMFDRAQIIASVFTSNYAKKFGVNISKCMPKYDLEYMKQLCAKVNSEFNYDMRCIGTPRNGNHYIEINSSNNDGKVYVSTHCGSCNLGSKIYQYHQCKISDNNKLDWNEINDEISSLRRKTRVPKILKAATDSLIDEARMKLHPNYLENEEAYEYFFDMIFAQCYAQLNRLTILKRVFNGLDCGTLFDEQKLIESVHNYIDFEDMIVRKGAIKLHSGQLGIVALNMRDGFLLIKGSENENIIKSWNYSCCHGCGRDYPRYEAKHKFSMRDFVKSMQGVYSTSIVEETLDECPNAYRNPDIIIDALKNRAEILGQYKTILNIKGYGK
jgi:tRNA-splicing ligase RtcB (3'-phosphate/5'-hydroxy nucleic acid ligase)